MTVQVTVRLPDDVAAFIDETVAAGAGSRAAIIAAAVRRERRRQAEARDARIYAQQHADADADALAAYVQPLALDID